MNVIEFGTGNISRREDFYRESNGASSLQIGSDTLIGAGIQNGANWSVSVSTAGLGGGNYTLYAVATDSATVVSDPVSTSLSVTGPQTPTIGSFTVSPTSVALGAAVTLDAANVTRSGGSISGVQFYRESNGVAGFQPGSDTLVGSGTQGGSNWLLASDTTDLAAGTVTYYAVATDNFGTQSAVSQTQLTITGPLPPTIGSFTVSPGSVAAGSDATLTASNVVAASGQTIDYVDFYRESNNTSGLQIGSDAFVGTGTQNGSTWTLPAGAAGLAPGSYAYYAVATDDIGASNTPVTTALNVTIPSLPLYNIQILASANQNGPYSSSLNVVPGGTYYFEAVGQLAPIGTSNTQGTTTKTITSEVAGVDGANSLSLNLLDLGSSAIPISFSTATLASASTTPSSAADWDAGTGASPGTPTSTGGGNLNELLNARPIHAPGVFTGVNAGAAGSEVIEFGTFVVASSVAPGSAAQVAGSFAGSTSSS